MSQTRTSSAEPASSVEPRRSSRLGRAASASTRDRRPVVDPRGQRFSAWLTTGLLVAALLLAPSAATVVLLAFQLAAFASGVLLGPARTPYAWLFKTFVRPRLGPPAETRGRAPAAVRPGRRARLRRRRSRSGTPPARPSWARSPPGWRSAAAFLNAAFGFCLGCEMYLRLGQAAAPGPR